jgi:hypothetical protein
MVTVRFLSQFDTGLRAGDALHLAVANNHRATAIYSLDKTVLKAGKILGLAGEHGNTSRVIGARKRRWVVAMLTIIKLSYSYPIPTASKIALWLAPG